MSAQSSQWSISGSIKVEGTPAISAHKASNAIGFFTSVRKAQSFWRLRRQTGHRQIETKRSIIERQKDGRHLEYYPSTKAGQVQGVIIDHLVALRAEQNVVTQERGQFR